MIPQPFDPTELGPGGEMLAGIATELVMTALGASPSAPADLVSRVLAAVATEPTPTPPSSFFHALGSFDLGAAWWSWVTSLGLVFAGPRVTTALRLQALAVVLFAALAVGAGGVAAGAGAAAVIRAVSGPPDVLLPTTSPSASPSPLPSPDLAASAEPLESPNQSESPEATEAPNGQAGDGSAASGGSNDAGSSQNPTANQTTQPRETGQPSDTP